MRLRHLLPLLLLAACSVPSQPLSEESSGISSAVVRSAPAQKPILQTVPTLAEFRDMRLSGTGLDLYQVLGDNDAYTRYAITYLSNGVKVSGILNVPKGEGPFPLLIFNHGYIAPSVYTQGRGLKREQDYLARQGFAVLHTDYRGHAVSDANPDESKVYDAGIGYSIDSANAVLAVRAAELPSVDATHVGMLGHSMGGGVTLNILTAHPELIDAAVLYAPVHADAWENYARWRNDRSEQEDQTKEVIGTRAENPVAWDARSSRTLLSEIEDPVLLFQGTNDNDVPASWSDSLHAALTALGKEITYVSYPGEGHEFGPQWNDFMQKSAEFFRTHLRGV